MKNELEVSEKEKPKGKSRRGKKTIRAIRLGRGVGTVYVIRLKNGELRYMVQTYDADGKLVRPTFRSLDMAKGFLVGIAKDKEYAKAGIPPERRPQKTILLGQLFTEYLAWRKSHSKANTPHTLINEERLAEYWLDSLGNTPLGEIKRADVSAIFQDITMRSSPPTANRYLAVLRGALNWAIREREYLTSNPIKGIKQHKENPGRIRWLEYEEAERLLNECRSNPRLLVFTAIGLYTGMRAGEIERLRWEDVNFERGTIFIPKSKNGESRTIPLEAPLGKLLATWPRTGEMVIGSYHYRKVFGKAVERAGIEDFTFHGLRHTYATWKLRDGTDLRTLAALLGHRTLAMVMRYTHPDLERARGKGMPKLRVGEGGMITLRSPHEDDKEVKANADKGLHE